MINKLKKILTTLLLLTMIISQFGYYFFYTYKQHLIKENVKHLLLATLPESSLQIFEANNTDINWEEENEFSIDGKMYDVAKIKTINGCEYLYCLSDDAETMLLKDYSKKNNDKSNNKHQKENNNNLKFQILSLNQIEQFFINHFFIKNKIVFPIYKQNIAVATVSVISPPPRI